MWAMTVIGHPKPQKRPRTFFIRNRTKPVTWSEKTDWYHLIYTQAISNKPRIRFEGPLRVETVFRMPKPQNKPKWKVLHNVRPDEDNLKKSLYDALTQAQIWKDDAQICESHFYKRYAVNGFEAGVTITIEQLNEKRSRQRL